MTTLKNDNEFVNSIAKIRKYYLDTFKNGLSDESFLTFLGNILNIENEEERENDELRILYKKAEKCLQSKK